MPRFGFFRKKGSDGTNFTEQSPITSTASQTGSITIEQAQDLLQNIETLRVKELAITLGSVKESASQSLKAIAELADELSQEKIRLEDLEQRYKSIVENSRKTLVSSLRRESSIEFQLPQTVNDAKKFKEKFETLMNRIGEVTRSHSKVLNVFMKKYANKLKSEFEALSKLLDEVRSAVSEFEQNRTPIVKCANILNAVLQKIRSIRSIENSMQNLEIEIKNIENELQQLKEQLDGLKKSSAYDQAVMIVQGIEEKEKQEEHLRMQIADMFSHVSRAFTKYSYNITKETEARLQVLSEEPWKIVEEEDISAYIRLLFEIRHSLEGGQIQLKDSDKVISYIDSILECLPVLHSSARALKKEKNLLLQGDSKFAHRARELDEKITQYEEAFARNTEILEQQKRQINEKSVEVESMLREASKILSELTGQEYSLQYHNSSFYSLET